MADDPIAASACRGIAEAADQRRQVRFLDRRGCLFGCEPAPLAFGSFRPLVQLFAHLKREELDLRLVDRPRSALLVVAIGADRTRLDGAPDASLLIRFLRGRLMG